MNFFSSRKMSWSFRIILISPLLLLGVIFVVLRLHINIFWNWGLIFIPFWFSLLIWIFIDIHGVITTKASQEYALYFVSGLGAVLVSIFLAFITIKEELHHAWPWAAVISPLWAALLMYCILLLTHKVVGSHTVLLGMTYLCLIPASILVAVRLDADSSSLNGINWAIIFIPLWIVFGVWFIALVISLASKLKKDPSHAKRKPYWTNLFVLSFMWMGLITFLILLTLELQMPGSIGFLFVFTPMIIVLSVIFIVPYVIIATRRKEKMRDKFIPWLTGITPIFWDFSAPTDLRTGKPLWVPEDQVSMLTSQAPITHERNIEDPDGPMNFIRRNVRSSADSS